MQRRQHNPQSLKYLLSGPLQKSLLILVLHHYQHSMLLKSCPVSIQELKGFSRAQGWSQSLSRFIWFSISFSSGSFSLALSTQSRTTKAQILVNASTMVSHRSLYFSGKSFQEGQSSFKADRAFYQKKTGKKRRNPLGAFLLVPIGSQIDMTDCRTS